MENLSVSQFKKYNNLIGWFTFAIATLVYLLTIEPTASFWDCSEFIASGNKLEVGHPPGAPFFMLMVRFFTMFAPSPQWVPILANSLSALASSFTILFLFWTITYMARRIVSPKATEFTLTQVILILSSGFVGALAYTFSDTFWFSAVEGEVYATSSLFTALVFWAILKWEEQADQPHATRWIILIAFLMGISIGIHLLNLLAIPAIALVYYFRKYSYSPKGLFYTLLISGVLLITIMYGIIQGFVVIASKVELLFVNSFGLPIKSGVFFLFTVVLALLAYGIYRTHKQGRVVLNTIFVGLTVIMIGYSSYAAIVIRSSANPPMDQNSPDNMFSLLYYLNREQYGDRPLLYGQVFNAQPIARVEGEPTYAPKNGKYVFVRTKDKYEFDPEFKMLFPRMWSNEQNHVNAYKKWSNFDGNPIKRFGPDGKTETIYVPTFGENLLFFFRYQLGFMYFRYFMWNFAGRQNDLQGHGEVTKGNWISGIPFIDNPRLGPQEKLPEIYRNNKGRNQYYLLPLLLGLAGLLYHLSRHKHDFWVTTMLFVMTGIAIVVYLNQTPYQPRERDYAYAGSFYAFTIWIGLGVLAVYELLKKIKDTPATAVVTASVCTLAVPVLMASENWDDHDRSGSYVPVDFGYNMLIGCKPNAILFTYGDNDTFPLWYSQEVEGVRTDVRVANLSYLRGEWYIEQMQRKAYQSDPIPIRMTYDQYFTGARDAIVVIDRIKEPLNLDRVVDFFLSDKPENMIQSPFNQNERINYIPSKQLFLTVDKSEVKSKVDLPDNDLNRIADTMTWTLNKQVVLKDGQVILDLIATNQWRRPIYYATTVSGETYLGLDKYFHLEGMMYRVLPIPASRQWGTGSVNTREMWENLMEKYRFRSLNNPKVYLDENKMRIVSNYRNLFARLANALVDEGKMDSAITALNRCMELIPPKNVPLNYFALSMVEGYYRAGDMQNALKYSQQMVNQASEAISYMIYDLDEFQKNWLGNELQLNLAILYELTRMANQYEKGEYAKQLTDKFNSYVTVLEG